ncbi:MAG: hypothetical protein EOO71_19005 [Myxococcaceae bacterium]|nr:MAG: hypothetical protein EOO71_19005 [Myxococcaceae bacterium]
MLKSLVLGFGPTPDQPPLTLPIGSAVVFVGPNNSGKSRLLLELEHFLKGQPPKGHQYLLLKDVECEVPRNEGLLEALVARVREDLPKVIFRNPGVPIQPETGFQEVDSDDLSNATRMLREGKLVLTPHPERVRAILKDSGSTVSAYFSAMGLLKDFKNIVPPLEDSLESELPESEQVLRALVREGVRMLTDMRRVAQERSEKEAILEVLKDRRVQTRPYVHLLGPETLRLDGRQRLEHVSPGALPSRSAEGDNPLTRLLRDPSARQTLRRLVHEAFGEYLSIDVSSFRSTEIKLSPEDPGEHELSPLRTDAIEYFRRARSIKEFSDGVKSFVGLLSAVLSSEYLVMLVDEPEAFLHPPLARRLGQNLHQLARERGAHVLAATHSADFLMGCIQSSLDVNIVRLTYREKVPTARLLPVSELKQMMVDPLLRSTGTLSALFHEGAVVCEGDSDRAFYQEINERLLRQKEGADGCLFMNAHSKQNIHRIVSMLRRMGIPAAAVVDLDLLLDENTLKDLLATANAEAAAINSLGAIKGEFYRLFFPQGGDRETCKARMKSLGTKALSDKQRQHMTQLFFKPLAQLGIFVVPSGEVESWLQELHPEGKPPAKSRWLNAIFEALGSDPAGRYVRPATGDVWDFMREIGSWLGNPNREGMPS